MLNMLNISPGKQKLIVCAVLTLITLAVYWQVQQYHFINDDDPVYVTNNIQIQSGITGDSIRWAFSTTYAEFWHPLTWLSLMLDYQLYGLKAGGYHVTGVILHLMSALLLFALFCRMTGAIWRSAFVAALFALHPLNVETVSWVAQRKDVLSAFFWMLTLYFYVYYAEKPQIKRYVIVVFSFLLALMSKPMVVTLPLVMILMDYWPLKRFESHKGRLILWQLKEKAPLFIFSAVFSAVTFYAQYRPSARPLSFYHRLAGASVSFVNYLGQIFWPHDLTAFYPYNNAINPTPVQIPILHVFCASVLILVVSIVVIVTIKRFGYLFAGWLWYAITILPVLGITQTGIHWTHDHYTYLPSIGIFIGIAWGIPVLFESEKIRRKILVTAAMAVVVIMSAISWQQCGYWKNSETLWRHAIKVTRDNVWAHLHLAYALREEGKLDEAIYYHDIMMLRFKRLNYAGAYISRGNAYFELGQIERAIEDYHEAIRMCPACAEYYNNRGNAFMKLGRYQPALDDFNKAIELKKDSANAYSGRGLIYLGRKNIKSGCADAKKACDLGNCKLLEAAKSRGFCR